MHDYYINARRWRTLLFLSVLRFIMKNFRVFAKKFSFGELKSKKFVMSLCIDHSLSWCLFWWEGAIAIVFVFANSPCYCEIFGQIVGLNFNWFFWRFQRKNVWNRALWVTKNRKYVSKKAIRKNIGKFANAANWSRSHFHCEVCEGGFVINERG